jgi:choline dehydrogenase
MQVAEFEYIVVGSGAGGGPLAANLARAGKMVLLLEAGGAEEDYNYQVPAFHGRASEDPAISWEFFVRHYTAEDQQRRDPKFTQERGGVFYPRAATLGGCTAHNAMITVYPHDHDWDEIAEATGDPSWRSDRMRRYFETLERCRYVPRPRAYPRIRWLAAIVRAIPLLSNLFGNPGRHGFDGWLSTSEADPTLALKDLELLDVIRCAIEEVVEEHLDRPRSILEGVTGYLDPNDWRNVRQSKEGLYFTPLATDSGKRNGSREYVRATQAAFPKNLTVKTHALVSKVLFDDGNTAIGVEYLDGAHLYRADPNPAPAGESPPASTAHASREVILSAGAFNTPQILKLSGIGPRAELARHGIAVRVDLPGVGENLQDRYEVGVVNEMEENFVLLADCGFRPPAPGEQPDPCFTAWQSGKGVYTTNGAALAVVLKSSQTQPDPDLFIFGLPANFQGYYPGYSDDLERNRNYFTWAILKAHTLNTAGTVRLRSANPRDVPEINFHYFTEGSDTEGNDLEAVVTGVEFARHVMGHTGSWVKREICPGPEVTTRQQVAAYVKDRAWGHHASCTCKMGPRTDPTAVVDSHFQVHGTKNLRVVDASVFPHIPGFFIVTAVYMLAEKASDDILAASRPPVARSVLHRVRRATQRVRRR